jgi:hypothetical protein
MIHEALDIVGDVHGNFDALERLGRELGYETANAWRHPGGRKLVFVGDLIDRGAKSFEVASLVKRLVDEGVALCLLGNHEYNLVQWWRGRARPKHSNEKTVEHVAANRAAWEPVLEFFETLPIALELPSVRVIHAVWHREAFHAVASALGAPAPHPTWGSFASHVALGSPFDGDELWEGLPEERHQPSNDRLHELLIKGYEEHATTPFRDNDGKERRTIRVCWWKDERDEIPRDKRTVFGHYWNVPPAEPHPHFAPPHPSGHHDLREWQAQAAARAPLTGRLRVPDEERFVCVDFNGVARPRETVGAYRVDTREVVWAGLT